MPINDDAMVKIMQSLGLNFNPAEQAIKSFEGRIASLNKQLLEMKALALQGARDINAAFSGQFGQLAGNKVILDQFGQPLKTVQVEAQKAAATVRDMAKSSDMMASAYLKSTRAAKEHGQTVQDVAKKYNILASEWQRRSSWFITGGLFYGSINAAKEAVQTISEVEMGVTQIARVMEDATFVFKDYRDELLQLGVDYGQTFETVQDIALRWAQAGYNVKDSLENTRVSLLALNTAELNASQATESLIGVMAQWGLTAKDLPLLLDKINLTADNFVITSDGLIAGLLKSSETAKNFGLTLDQTIALLTTMKEASGATGKEIGNALRSILVFTQRDKTINVLESLGISSFADAAKTQFRPVWDIFQDVAAKWGTASKEIQDGFIAAAEDAGLLNEELTSLVGMGETWTDVQKRDIAEGMAGNYRRNYIISLITRLAQAQKVLNGLTDAAGYSQRENARTMETLEKKYESLKAAAQQLAVNIGDSGLTGALKGVVDGTTDAINWFNGLDSSARNLIITFAEVTAAIKILQATGIFSAAGAFSTSGLFKGAASSLAIAKVAPEIASMIGYATAAVKNIGSGLLSLFGGPWGLAIAAATTGIISVVREQKELERQTIESNKAQEKFTKAVAEFERTLNPEKINEVTNALQELKNALNYDEDTPKKIEEIRKRIEELQNSNTQQSARGYAYGINDIEIAKLQKQLSDLESKYTKVSGAEKQANYERERANALNYQAQQEIVKNVAAKIREIEAEKQLVKQYEQSLNAKQEDTSLRDQLLEKYPQYLKMVGEHSDKVTVNTSALTENLNIQEKLAKAQVVEAQMAMRASHEKTQQILNDTQTRIAALKAEQEAFNYTGDSWLNPVRSSIAKEIEEKSIEVERLKQTIKIQEDFYNMSPDDLIKAYGASGKGITSAGSGSSTKRSETNEPLQNALRLLEHKKHLNQISIEDEIAYLRQIEQLYVKNGEERMDIEERIYDAEQALKDKRLQDSINWINEKKFLDQLSAEEEIAAWNRVLTNQKDNIEAVKEATQNLYRLQKELREKDVEDFKDSLKEQQDAIKDAYNERIQQIDEEAERKKQVQQDIIDGIEEEMNLLDRQESKYDYTQKIADLKEQLAYWSVRTSEEARQKVADINKQIDEAEHDREVELQRQKLEDKKKAAEDEIDAIEEAAKAEREKWEKSYKLVEKAFDEHSINIIAAAGEMAEGAYQQWVDKYIKPLQRALETDNLEDFEDIAKDLETSTSSMSKNAQIYSLANSILSLKGQYEYGGDKSAEQRAARYYDELEELGSKGRTVADALHSMNYETAKSYVESYVAKLPESHKGSLVLSDGAANLQAGELIFPKNLSTDLRTLITVVSGITGKVGTTSTNTVTTDNRKEIKIDKLLNIENNHMEDEVDSQILSRELKRAVLSII